MVIKYKPGQKVEYIILSKPLCLPEPQFLHLQYEYQNCDGGRFSSAGCSDPLLNFIHIMGFLLEKKKSLNIASRGSPYVPSIRSVSHSLRIFLFHVSAGTGNEYISAQVFNGLMVYGVTSFV